MDFIILNECVDSKIISDLKVLIQHYSNESDYHVITRKVFKLMNNIKDEVLKELEFKSIHSKFGDVFNINNFEIEKFERFLSKREFKLSVGHLFWSSIYGKFSIKYFYNKISGRQIDVAYNDLILENYENIFVDQIIIISMLISTLYNYKSHLQKGRKKQSKRLFFEDVCYMIFNQIPKSKLWLIEDTYSNSSIDCHLRKYEMISQGKTPPIMYEFKK